MAKGCTVNEILDYLEEINDNEEYDVFTAPPIETKDMDTDCDSDKSDEEHEGILAHLGRMTLRSEGILQQRNAKEVSEEFSSEDDKPLSKLVTATPQNPAARLKSTKIIWKKSPPNYGNIVTDCIPIPPSAESQNCEYPSDFFKLFFDDDLLKHILEQTNLYVLQKNKPLQASMDELYVVIGGILLSGYGKYPNKRMYWSKECDVPHILSESMRLNRFEHIISCVHLNNNLELDTNDRLFKLRPIIDALNCNFRKHGGVKENLSVDESMIPYFGKHYFKQFIKAKPIRFGFKNWALCDSNGYLMCFQIYCGRSSEQNQFGVGGDVVLSLLSKADIPSDKGFKVFFDNYFSSVPLMMHLSELKYCATGTIQDNRTLKCPVEDKKKMDKQVRGTADYRTSSAGVSIVRWKDNKVVTIATTYDKVENTSCLRWSKEQKAKLNIPQPIVISKYNKYMGGVDKMDQLVAVYRSRIRQRKWWWPIFVYLLDVSITNAWLLMRELKPTKRECQNLLSFRRNIALNFLKTYGIPAKVKQIPQPTPDVQFDRKDHIIRYNGRQQRCRLCKKNSQFICKKCGVSLHPKTCFEAYHTPE